MNQLLKTGLVLSGGGAKGAYHVGVIKALHELDVQIDAISGASIGALNGAIVAASPSLEQGYQRLAEIWGLLAKQTPLSINNGTVAAIPAYLSLLSGFGMRVHPTLFASYLAYRTSKAAINALDEKLNHPITASLSQFFELVDKKLQPKASVLNNDPLQQLINTYLDWDGLQKGTPFYVSVYKSNSGLIDLTECALAMLSLKETRPSDFFCLQQLPASEQKQALMASAALPLLYESHKIQGSHYTDGGQGGWSTLQGNTPITPLIKHGCNLVIVTHLSDGSFWDRHQFPETTVIDIRPQRTTSRDGIADLLAFQPDRIPSWIDQGYEDTMACMAKIKEALENRQKLARTMQSQRVAEGTMLDSADRLQSALKKLKA